MAEPTTDVLEMVLRDVASARTEPWYPADYAQATGVPREQLDACLDRLRLSGLVRLTDWVQGRGQGYTLTPEGAQVLDSPRLLARLREGRELPRRLEAAPEPAPRSLREPGTAWDRGEAIRAALLDQSRPVFTKTLIWINVAVFGIGLWMAMQGGVSDAYLSRGAPKIAEQLGAMTSYDVTVKRQWWRLVSCAFVHHGFLHILLNMVFLYMVGSLAEKLWGGPRYLLLYLVAAVGGSCAHVLNHAPADQQGVLAGASGALFGILASMPVWIVLNRAYLPRALASDWMRRIMMNLIFLAAFSFMPGISWEGHLGGAVAGAAVAVPLNFSRFGRGAQRWLGWAGVAAVPALCLALVIRPARGDDRLVELPPDNRQVQQARKRYRDAYLQADSLATAVYEEFASKLLQGRADPKATPAISRQYAVRFEQTAKELRNLAGQLQGVEGQIDRDVAAHVERGRQFIEAWARFYTMFAESLAHPENWGAATRQALSAQYDRVLELNNLVRNSPIFAPPED